MVTKDYSASHSSSEATLPRLTLVRVNRAFCTVTGGGPVGCSYAHHRPTPQSLPRRSSAKRGSPKLFQLGNPVCLHLIQSERHGESCVMYYAWSRRFQRLWRQPVPSAVQLWLPLARVPAKPRPLHPPLKREPPQCGYLSSGRSESSSQTGKLTEAGA